MANPQKENGYTAIANEVLEQIYKLPLNGTQFKILLVILRYTYGFSRKQHEFSLAFLAEAVNVHKIQLQRELKKLIKFKIIFVVKFADFNNPQILKFNKNYDKWVLTDLLTVSELVNSKQNMPVTVSELVNSTVSELVNQERKIKTNEINSSSSSRESRPKSFDHYEKSINMLTPKIMTDIYGFLDDGFEDEVICRAIDEAVTANVRNWNYASKVLVNCFQQGVMTVEQFNILKAERTQAKQEKPRQAQSKGKSSVSFDLPEFAKGSE